MKRYDIEQTESWGVEDMVERPEGDWVKYADLPEVIRKATLEGVIAALRHSHPTYPIGGFSKEAEAIVSKLEGGKL